jgi:hypothetical protein
MRTTELRPRGWVVLDWMPVRGKIAALVVGSVLGTAGATGTVQAERGLTVDPQSPAGVEYAVPLDAGRGHGNSSGHSGSTGGGGNPSPAGGAPPNLFGSGITPPGKESGGRKHGRGGGHGAGAGAAGTGQTAPAPVRASTEYSSSGPLAALIAALLLLGGGLGVFVRLRRRRT